MDAVEIIYKEEIINTLYKELFNIKLVHPAYATPNGSEIFNQVKVEPDKDTKILFKRLDIDYRCVNDTIICFVRSKLATPPARYPQVSFVTPEADFKIRFLLSVTGNFLGNTYTAAAGSKLVYHFTNTINNVQSSNRYITKVIENYNAANSYDAGTIVNSGGDPFVTLLPVNAAAAISIANNTYWKKVLPSEQVVNNADLQSTDVVKPTATCFAVIDVFNTGTTNAAYNLYGAGQQLLSPLYVIPFKSKN